MADDVNLRVITPTARLSYPYLFEPSKGMNGSEGKYQCELIFAEGADLSELRAAARAAAKEKWGDKLPAGLRSPFRKGSEREGKAGYEGDVVFISPRSTSPPGVVQGVHKSAVSRDQKSEVYGGCYVKCSVTAFAYDVSGNKGVSFALNNVWKLRDGNPLGSSRSAQDEFGSLSIDPSEFEDELSESML